MAGAPYDPGMRRAHVVVALLGLAGPSLADTRATTPAQQHREGEYGGVSPGEPPAKDARPHKKARRGTLSWIGFEAKDGGAQVFLQSAAPFEVTQTVVGSTLIVHVNLTRLGRNTWRPIDTRFFDNPLAGIVARRVGAARATKTRPAHRAGIDLKITFKNPKDAREATVTTKTEADGMFYAYLTFPEGAEPSGPSIDEPEQ